MSEIVEEYGDRYIGYTLVAKPSSRDGGTISVYYYGGETWSPCPGRFIWRRYYYGNRLMEEWESHVSAERHDTFLPDDLVRAQPPVVVRAKPRYNYGTKSK